MNACARRYAEICSIPTHRTKNEAATIHTCILHGRTKQKKRHTETAISIVANSVYIHIQATVGDGAAMGQSRCLQENWCVFRRFQICLLPTGLCFARRKVNSRAFTAGVNLKVDDLDGGIVAEKDLHKLYFVYLSSKPDDWNFILEVLPIPRLLPPVQLLSSFETWSSHNSTCDLYCSWLNDALDTHAFPFVHFACFLSQPRRRVD